MARGSILFEQNEYKRGLLDFEKLLESDKVEERNISSNKYVVPRKKREKEHVFEYLMKCFGKESQCTVHYAPVKVTVCNN